MLLTITVILNKQNGGSANFLKLLYTLQYFFQLLPSSIDLLCSNLVEDCDSSTLDDIEQVLKDAENFDILA